MPFARPTLTQLRDSALQSIAGAAIRDDRTGEVVNPLLLRFDPLTILAKAMAGLAYEEFGYLDWIALQATPFTATDEAALAWGGLVGISLKGATRAAGRARFTGTGGLPAGTQLVRRDGAAYATTADGVTGPAGVVTVPFEAAEPGTASGIIAGSALILASPVAGLNSAGVVTASTAPGSDPETLEDLRARYLARFAEPPHGGSRADYLSWALTVPGVTRAWVTGSAMGPGTVGIHIMLDGPDGDGFPVGTNGISPGDNAGRPRDILIAAGDQATVADALLPLQPVAALVYVSAPTPRPVHFRIENMGAANTAAIRASVAAALADAFLQLGDPRGTVIFPSVWNQAVSSVPGIGQFSVVAPTASIVLAVGELPVVGTVQFDS